MFLYQQRQEETVYPEAPISCSTLQYSTLRYLQVPHYLLLSFIHDFVLETFYPSANYVFINPYFS